MSRKIGDNPLYDRIDEIESAVMNDLPCTCQVFVLAIVIAVCLGIVGVGLYIIFCISGSLPW